VPEASNPRNAVHKRTEGGVNYRVHFQNLNGIKEYTILIGTYLYPDHKFLDPRGLCGNLDDTLYLRQWNKKNEGAKLAWIWLKLK
jgi:hypothetical protein